MLYTSCGMKVPSSLLATESHRRYKFKKFITDLPATRPRTFKGCVTTPTCCKVPTGHCMRTIKVLKRFRRSLIAFLFCSTPPYNSTILKMRSFWVKLSARVVNVFCPTYCVPSDKCQKLISWEGSRHEQVRERQVHFKTAIWLKKPREQIFKILNK